MKVITFPDAVNLIRYAFWTYAPQTNRAERMLNAILEEADIASLNVNVEQIEESEDE